jgi:dTDP-4-amino-4,6-dideoxygalactose transaminase
MDRTPAVLGSQPVFESRVPIVRPTLPDFNEVAEGLRSIFTSGMLTAGRYLRGFEAAVAEHLGVKHAVAVASCTTGLMLTYRGLGLTGDVVVPSFTFMATVSALSWAGLRPVFADVDVGTTTLDPDAVEVAITPRTSAIVAVHNFGNPADIEELQGVARCHDLKLIFDAAHGFGALYQGMPVGPQGDAQVYSLSPTKLLIAGEGGIVATNNDALAKYVRIGREYGNSGNYDSAFAGLNARMSEFHALLGLQSLQGLETAVRSRNHLIMLYQEQLARLPGIGFQQVRPGNRCSYKDFSITVDEEAFGLSREHLTQALARENIDTRKYYAPPVHRQTAYRAFAPSPDILTGTNVLAARSLSLPLWSHMEEAMVLRICRTIQQIHAYAEDVRSALRRQSAVSVSSS